MNLSFLDHLSYSSLSLFSECPACWVERYRDGIVPPKSKALELGSEVHKAVESYHKGSTLPQYHKLSYYLKAYSKVYKPEDFSKLEDKFLITVKSPDNSGFELPLPLMGFIDRVWNDELHELKTSARPYKQEDVDGRMQTSIYALAFEDKYGTLPRRIVYNVLIKKERPRLQILDTKCNREQIRHATQWIWRVFRSMTEYNDENPVHICRKVFTSQ